MTLKCTESRICLQFAHHLQSEHAWILALLRPSGTIWRQRPVSTNNTFMTSSNGNIFRVTGLFAGNSPVIVKLWFFICAWTNNWANTEGTGDLRRRCAIVMLFFDSTELFPETILTQYYWYQYISVQCHRKWEWYAGKTYNFKIILKDFSISTRGQWVQSATTELNVSFLIECHIHIKCIDSSCVTRDYNSCP